MLSKEMKDKIDSMSHEEMASAWRFAPIGDPMFQGEMGEYFKERFDKLGMFNPTLSKKIGWDN